MAALSLQNVGLKVEAFSLNNISIEVEQGAYFILLGPSGSGKSLILEMIAGFYHPHQGKIILDGSEITHSAIQKRNVGMLFQDFAVFPHLNVFDNIAYSLKKKQQGGNSLNYTVEKLAAELEISHLLYRNIRALSGGEQQRVALARILARKPKVLLLDEPLSSLDVQLRSSVRTMLRRLNNQGQTILHVTHDYEEAAILGHRIAVIENNSIVQCGTHDEVFHHPRSAFVANFVGINNYFGGILQKKINDIREFIANGVTIRVLTDQPVGRGFVVIRSEDIILSANPLESSATNSIVGIITCIEPARLGYEVTVDTGIPVIAQVSGESVNRLQVETGKSIWVTFKASAVRFIAE